VVPHPVGENYEFLECDRPPYPGTAYVLKKPIDVENMLPCVFTMGDSRDRLHLRRLHTSNRRYINSVISRLICAVETFAPKKTHIKRPLRWQFKVRIAKNVEWISEPGGNYAAAYFSGLKNRKICYWGQLKLRIQGLWCADGDEDPTTPRQYFPLMDVTRVEVLDKPRKGCLLWRYSHKSVLNTTSAAEQCPLVEYMSRTMKTSLAQ